MPHSIIRINFLKQQSEYGEIQLNDESPVEIRNMDGEASIFGTLLLARVLLNLSDLEETRIAYSREEIDTFFGGSSHKAYKAIATLQATFSRIEGKPLSYELNKIETHPDYDKYVLEINTAGTTTIICDIKEVLRKYGEVEDGNLRDLQDCLHSYRELYEGDFYRTSKASKPNKWGIKVRDLVRKSIETVCDQYVIAMLNEGMYRKARQFIEYEWIDWLEQVQKIDHWNLEHVYWRYLRLIQAIYQSKEMNKRDLEKRIKRILRELKSDTANPITTLLAKIDQLHGSHLDDQALKAAMRSLASDYRAPYENRKNLKGFQRVSSSEITDRDRYPLFLNEVELDIKKWFEASHDDGIAINPDYASGKFGSQLSEPMSNLMAEQERLLLTHRLLLVSGEPGVGKTRFLQNAAAYLFDRSQSQRGSGIPLLFGLSSWKYKRKSIAEWLKDMSKVHYRRSWKPLHDLIDCGEVSLLLDGFEDIPKDGRLKFMHHLSEYIKTFGRAHIILTCRTRELQDFIKITGNADFPQQSEVLENLFHINILPLSINQIEDCLINSGHQVDGLLALLRLANEDTSSSDAAIARDYRENFAPYPLYLSMMLSVYQDRTLEAILQNGKPNNDDLIEKVVEKRLSQFNDSQTVYNEATTRNLVLFLRWLAAKDIDLITPYRLKTNFLTPGVGSVFIQSTRRIVFILLSLITCAITVWIGHGIYTSGGVVAPWIAEATALAIWMAAWSASWWDGSQKKELLLVSQWSFSKIPIFRTGDLKAVRNGFLYGFIAVIAAIIVSQILINVINTGSPIDDIRNSGIATLVLSALLLGLLMFFGFSRQKTFGIIGWLLMGITAGPVYGLGTYIIAQMIDYPNIPSAVAAGVAIGLAVGIGPAVWKFIAFSVYEGCKVPETVDENPSLMVSHAWSLIRLAIIAAGFMFIFAFSGIEGISAIVDFVGNPSKAARYSWSIPLWLIGSINAAVLFGISTLLFYGGLEIVEHWLVQMIIKRECPVQIKDYPASFILYLDQARQLNFMQQYGKAWKFTHERIRDYFRGMPAQSDDVQ